MVIFDNMEQKWTNKLNNDEFNLIVSPWYPLLKKSAIDKIKSQMQNLGEELQAKYPSHFYKITLGENLQNLPYLVLDFPKIAGPDFPFVCRTLFWWGRGIYFQFILKSTLLPQDFWVRSEPNIFVYTGTQIWENDLQNPEYRRLASLSAEERASVQTEKYVKLVREIDIKKTDNLFEEAIGFYQNFEELFGLTAQ